MATVQNWGQAVQTAFANGLAVLLAGIPKIIGFLIILIIGWIIASIIAKAVLALLHAVKFNDVAEKAGVAGFVKDMGVDTDSSGVLADVVKWFIRLIVLVAAFDALGLPQVSAVLQRLLLWIPNLVVAIVVLVIGGLLAKTLGRIVRGAATEAGFGSPAILGGIASAAIWGFAFIVALDQIGVAATLVNTLLIGLVAALALAFGLAFGLGGRDTAAQIVSGWYASGKQAAPKIQQMAESKQQQSKSDGQRAAAVPVSSANREQRSR